MGFFKNLFRSLSPFSYSELTRNGFGSILRHFALMMLLMVTLSSLLYLPKFMLVPYQANNEFNKFETFSIETDVVTREPVDFGFVKIDTDGPEKDKIKGIYVNDQVMQVQFLPWGGPSTVNLDDLKDVLRNRETIRANMILLTILLIPYMYFLVLFYHIIKFLFLAVFTGILMIMLIRTGKGDVSGIKVFKISLYGTIVLTLELFLQVFNISWWAHSLLPYLLYLVFVLIATMYIMSHDKHHRHMPEVDDVFKPKKKTKKHDDEDIFSGTNIDEEIDVDLIKKDLEKSSF